MKKLIWLFPFLACVAQAADIESRLVLHPATTTLLGPEAYQQLAVTLEPGGGDPVDVTRHVRYESSPAGIVSVDAKGFINPLRNGTAVIKAYGKEGGEAEMQVTVSSIEAVPPINFPNEIVPLFTKHGCNSGGCHGKSEGQNGFRLSLLGFEPTEDYEYLRKESRGRRIFPAAPEFSLLVRKAMGDIPHGGGDRMKAGGYSIKMIIEWIRQGMPYGQDNDPVVERISVFPIQRIVQPGTTQQLVVTAHYSDGSARDVSRVVQYESNEKEMAEVDEQGHVSFNNETGNVAVMIRFQEKVDVFQAIIPLGAPVDHLPDAKNFIDELVFEKLRMLGLPPSDNADDATFLRRVSIDIAGRLPTIEESSAFAADADPQKRAKLIDRLLSSPEYADYFANKWSAILRNKRNKDFEARGTYSFHGWIKTSLYENKPYDRFMRDIVTAQGEIGQNPPVAWYRQVKTGKEQLQDIAQVFLGVRLQCAECHHHPFEKWSQDDYYGFLAFFNQVGRKPGNQPGEEVIYHKYGKASAQQPKTKASLPPTALEGKPLELQPEHDPRRDLAAWMGDSKNPFFAKMLVNRYWKHFFGRGMVEPEDDIRVTNPATHPKLLNRLADEFVKSGYDLKELVRTLTNSQAYQLSSIPNQYNGNDRQNYSRYYPRRLSAEVLLDSIDTVTDQPTRFAGLPAGTRAVQLPDNSFNSKNYFLEVFGRPEMDSACECERNFEANLAQSLHLLNSKSIQDKIAGQNGRASQLYKEQDRPVEARVSELYLHAFSRLPEPIELEIAGNYLKSRKDTALKQGYEDVVWALINTKEFLFNH